MPLNESTGIRRSNLTRQQQREAEAAIYGLPTNNNQMELEDLTPQDIERMRAIVQSHDRTTGKIETFDLNKPPQQPLVFRPYPKMIYHHGKRAHKVIQNEEQLAEHLGQGWDTQPYPAEPPEPVHLDAAAAAEAAAIDTQLKALREKKK